MNFHSPVLRSYTVTMFALYLEFDELKQSVIYFNHEQILFGPPGGVSSYKQANRSLDDLHTRQG